MQIPIPEIFRVRNNQMVFNTGDRAKGQYGHATRNRGKASACVQCGQCESACPQHLPITEHLQKAAEMFPPEEG